eukprot:1358353-Rhodomonas_salina.1
MVLGTPCAYGAGHTAVYRPRNVHVHTARCAPRHTPYTYLRTQCSHGPMHTACACALRVRMSLSFTPLCTRRA